jgi:hypothetical protein
MPEETQISPPPEPPEPLSTHEEPTPMLDVHPAHHAASTWRDFFIHIATIVIGLLIAIALEQTVEHFHQLHQLQELRRGELTDARIYLEDVDQLTLANSQQIEDLSQRIQQVRLAIAQHEKLVPPFYRPAIFTNTIRLGNLSAARESGLIHLLPEDEINSAGDAEVGVAKAEALKERAQEATLKRVAFEQRFQSNYPAGEYDFSRATPAQLDEYLGILIEERLHRTETLDYLGQMHRGVLAFIQGQRNLGKLREAEAGASSPSQH